MKLLRTPLLSLLCLTLAGIAAAQDAPPEKTLEVTGKVPKEMLAKWTPGKILVLKNGNAVKTALEAMQRPTRDAKEAATEVEKFNDPKKPPEGFKNPRELARGKATAEKKYKSKLAVYEEAQKKFKKVLQDNTLSTIEYDEKYEFVATVPFSQSIYFSVSAGERGYLWIERAKPKIEFTVNNWMRDLTFTPKPEPPKK